MKKINFKLGLDLHGVIDANPTFFVTLAKDIVSRGSEVHIITGESYFQAECYLLELDEHHDQWWTHFYSIDDDFLDQGIPFVIREKNGRYYDEDLWNKAKVKYCLDWQISFHIDDSEKYLEYFTTPYYFYRNFPEDDEYIQKYISSLI